MTDQEKSSIIVFCLTGLFVITFLNLWAIERDKKLFEHWDVETTELRQGA